MDITKINQINQINKMNKKLKIILYVNDMTNNIPTNRQIRIFNQSSEDVVIRKDLTVKGKTDLRDDVKAKKISTKRLKVRRSSKLKGDVSMKKDLIVDGDIQLGSKLTVFGTTLLHDDVTLDNNLDVSGTTHLVGDVTLDNNLDVSGTTHLVGDVTLDNNLDVSGNLNVRTINELTPVISQDASGTLIPGSLVIQNGMVDVSGVDNYIVNHHAFTTECVCVHLTPIYSTNEAIPLLGVNDVTASSFKINALGDHNNSTIIVSKFKCYWTAFGY